MEDRRKSDFPIPPEGTDERRHCSDDKCRASREEWYCSTILPKLMNKLYALVAATVLALSGLFMYLSQNAIRDFELRMKDEYESRQHHEQDISRIEKKFDQNALDVMTRLDRNLEEIRKAQEPHK